MAITYTIDHALKTGGSAGSVVTSGTLTIVSTSVITVMVMSEDNTTAGTLTISNSGTALSWTQIAVTNTASNCKVQAWRAFGDANGNRTVTVTAGQPNQYMKLSSVVHAGAHQTTPVPAGKVFSGVGTTDVSQAITPTASGSCLWMCAADWNATNTFAARASNTLESTSNDATRATFTVIRPTTQPLSSGSAFTMGETDTSGKIAWIAFEVVAAAGGVTHYTMPAVNGTLTLAGQTNRLARSRDMDAVNGTLTLAGPTVNLIYSGAGPKSMPGGIGFLAASGRTVTLARSRKMPSVNGTLTLAGQVADLDADRRAAGGLGILTLAGQANRMAYGQKGAAGKGQLTLAGPVVNLIYSGAGAKVLPAGLGFPVLSGRTAVLRYSRNMPAAVSMATLGGQLAVLTYTAVEGDIVMPVSAGVLRMAGQSAFLDVTRIPPKPMELKFGRKVYLRRW